MNYTVWQDESAGLAATTSMPVIYIHSFRGNGEDVWQACREMPGCPPMVLVSVNNPGGGLDDELSPWPAPAVWKGHRHRLRMESRQSFRPPNAAWPGKSQKWSGKHRITDFISETVCRLL